VDQRICDQPTLRVSHDIDTVRPGNRDNVVDDGQNARRIIVSALPPVNTYWDKTHPRRSAIREPRIVRRLHFGVAAVLKVLRGYVVYVSINMDEVMYGVRAVDRPTHRAIQWALKAICSIDIERGVAGDR